MISSSSNLTRLRNEATALRTRQEFQRSQLTELANTDFGSWAKESFEIAAKIAYRIGGRIGIPRVRIGTNRWSQRLPCFLRETWLMRAVLLIDG